MNDYYQILEKVEPNASQDQIKNQYRFLVQAWHPDKFGSPESKSKAEEKLKQINEAFSILKDPTKRAKYDADNGYSQKGYNHQAQDEYERQKREQEAKVKAERQREQAEAQRREQEAKTRAEAERRQREQAEAQRREQEAKAEAKRREEEIKKRKDPKPIGKWIWAAIVLILLWFGVRGFTTTTVVATEAPLVITEAPVATEPPLVATEAPTEALAATEFPTFAPTFTSASSVEVTTLPTRISQGFTTTPPIIDGWIAKDEWKDAILISEFPHGNVYYLNDSDYLYLLVDSTGDTAGGEDMVGFTFDINKNSIDDMGVDIEYYTNIGFRFCYSGQYDKCYLSNSKFNFGFGTSPFLDVKHRYWEFAIDLSEINSLPGELVHLGYYVYSQSPGFTDTVRAYDNESVMLVLGAP